MSSLTLLLAFGFGNLAMLGWLAAAAAPILIHLWSRHRHREAPWAAMQFLLSAVRKNSRRIQLQQWLLLALRTLIILLVVLAVAQPHGEQLMAGGAHTPRHKILVIDDSYSMGYRGSAETNFELAKELATDAIRSSSSGDAYTVICMSDRAGRIAGPGAADSNYVAAQIENIPLSFTAASLDHAITLIDEALGTSKDSRNPVQTPEVYMFTDLQRATWRSQNRANAETAQSPPGALGSKLKNLAEKVAVTIIDLGQPQATNLAITNLRATEPFITRGQPISLYATLHQFGNEPRLKCVAELLVDDVPVAEQTVDVPANSDAVAHFAHQFQTSGNHTVCVRAQGDQLPVDNSRWLVVPVREQVRVLCVIGREGAAKYLTSALAPGSADSSPISPVVVNEGDFANAALADFDCVFLCNVAQFTPRETERLARFAANGGGVVFFLGDRVTSDGYSALVPSESTPNDAKPSAGAREADGVNRATSLLPTRIGEPVTNPQFGLDPLEYRHPIVSLFRGQERAGLATTPINRYFQLVVPPDRGDAQIAASLPNGEPFIVTAPFGRGRIAVVATDASLSSIDPRTNEPWTTWPTWPSFLPLVRELLAYALSGEQGVQQQLVGTPIVGRTSSVSSDPIRVQRPDGITAEIAVPPASSGDEWSYSDTNVCAIYKVIGAPKGGPELFAVNVNTEESDLAKLDPVELPREVALQKTWSQSSSSDVAKQFERAAWNGPLLLLAIVALFVESFLAWRFGRGAV